MIDRYDAPWPIPATAQRVIDHRQGYQQVRYCWHRDGWYYQARWHFKLPKATLINQPSWQLSRTRPGQGFGSDAHPKSEETLVGDHWLPTSQVRYAARCYNKGQASNQQTKLLQQAHFPGN